AGPARIAEPPPNLHAALLRLAELAGSREPEQLVVGAAAPKKERAARRKLDVAQRELGAVRPGPRLDAAIQKIGAREHGRDEMLDARVESTEAAAGLEERHQTVDIVRLDGAAERSAGEIRGDALGASALLLERLGLADEDLLSARRAGQALRLERSLDLDAADDARRALLARVAEAAVRREAVDQLVGRRAGALDERH